MPATVAEWSQPYPEADITSQTKADQVILRDEELAHKKAPESDASSDVFAALAAEEAGHDIKFRTLTWQKATLLLFGEYVCLAILALPWSYSVLGWGAGLCVQIFMGLLTWCEFPCGVEGPGGAEGPPTRAEPNYNSD